MAVIYMPQDQRYAQIAQGLGGLLGGVLQGYIQGQQLKQTMANVSQVLASGNTDPAALLKAGGGSPQGMQVVGNILKMMTEQQELAKSKAQTGESEAKTKQITGEESRAEQEQPLKIEKDRADLVKSMVGAQYAEGEAQASIAEKKASTMKSYSESAKAQAEIGKIPLEEAKLRADTQKSQAEAAQAQMLTGDSDAKNQLVDGIVQGKVNPADLSSRNNSRAAFVAAARQKDPTYIDSRFKTTQEFADGRKGDNVRYISNAMQHIETARAMVTALQNGNDRLANIIGNAWAKQFGKPVPTTLQTISQIVGPEIIKAIVASGGGEEERQDAAKAIADMAASPAQSIGPTGSLNGIEDLLKVQMQGLANTYSTGTGWANDASNPNSFNNRILPPEAKRIFGDLQARTQGTPLGTTSKIPAGAPTATNPKTGQKMFWDGKQWQMVQ